MKVLLLGATGNVGSRMFPALLARKHEVVVYARSTSKISAEVSTKADAVVVGSGTDSEAIKTAILDHNCDAVINSAGLASFTAFHKPGQFPEIFAAVVKAVSDARKERGGPPLRCWFLSGWSALDAPLSPYLLVDYIPVYPTHKNNFQLINSLTTDDLAWSLFCASNMTPKYELPRFPPPTDVSANNLVARANAPPAFKDTYRNLPLVGGYLNIISQAQTYYAALEDCVDFMVADLELGLQSEWIGKRVGVKEKEKAI